MGQVIYHNVGSPFLQSGADMTKWATLLQSGAVITKQCSTIEGVRWTPVAPFFRIFYLN